MVLSNNKRQSKVGIRPSYCVLEDSWSWGFGPYFDWQKLQSVHGSLFVLEGNFLSGFRLVAANGVVIFLAKL